jgi:hypothetical protein
MCARMLTHADVCWRMFEQVLRQADNEWARQKVRFSLCLCMCLCVCVCVRARARARSECVCARSACVRARVRACVRAF